MAKKRYLQLSEKEKNDLLKKFFSAVASLGTYKEIANFFKDLLQADETVMLARRLKIAELLEKGGTYEEISQKMNAGYDTISRVNHWRQYGRKGYHNAIKHLKMFEERSERRRIHQEKMNDPFSWYSFENKYNRINNENIDETIFQLQNFIKRLKRKKSVKKAQKKISKN